MKYPIFIPTKGRFNTPMTINTFKKINVDFKIVIEEQEYKQYLKIVDESKIIVLPHKNKGLTVTRNWIWDYAEKEGFEKFWTFDDNIVGIYRADNNIQVKVADSAVLEVIENFSDRYENLTICGMNYHGFCKAKQKLPPYYPNTRIYSNMLIKTNSVLKNGEKLRNKLFFNDDTDLCLRVLKNGDCTIQFNAFLIDKQQTMITKGGMTEYYNETNSRKEFAEELMNAHPDVVKVTEKFGRYHHQVNYKPFRKNKLKFKTDYEKKNGINNFGMKLKEINNETNKHIL